MTYGYIIGDVNEDVAFPKDADKVYLFVKKPRRWWQLRDEYEFAGIGRKAHTEYVETGPDAAKVRAWPA